MSTNYYCDECNCETLTREIVKDETTIVRGKDVTVPIKIRICTSCENEVFDEILANNAMKAINDKYLTLYYGLSTEVIRSTRLQFPGLGQRPYAKILGVGSASVLRHETGDLPSEKHLEIYRSIKENPEKIFDYYKLNYDKLSKREIKKVDQVLNEWKEKKGGENPSYMQDDEEIIEAIHKPWEGTVFSGYRSFDIDRFINMILFFSKSGVAKTKLMKLLWYADFLKFKRETVSLSGAVYTRMKFGPVPKDHDILLAHLQHMGLIKIEEEVINEQGWTKMTIRAEEEFDHIIFKNSEMKILYEVRDALGDMGSREISEYSHNERGWKETKDEEPITYSFANDLNEFRV